MSFNSEKSRELGREIEAKPKECFNNAFRALALLPGSSYIEGYAIFEGGLLIEHGWLEYQGETLDPTMPEGADWYEPGLRYSQAELLEALAEDPELPIFYRFGWGGRDSPSMREANRRIWARMGVTLPTLPGLDSAELEEGS